MADWRPAQSLVTLRNQLDAAYPGWLFLGYLGDAAHAAVASDHNPNAQGVVCALDIGPGGGLDIHGLADNLLANRHPDLKYLISNRRIAGAWTNWQWSAYDGSDPHDTHIHVSVGVGPDGQSVQPYDDTVRWNVKGATMTPDSLNALAQVAWNRDTSNPEVQRFIKDYTGRDPLETIVDVLNSDINKDQRNKAAHFDEVNTALKNAYLIIDKLKAEGQGSVTQAEIDALAKQADALEQAIKAVNK